MLLKHSVSRSALLLLGILSIETAAQNASITTPALSYAPITANCSYGPLVRNAKNKLSWQEQTYVTSRKIRANIALDFWLENTQEKFELKTHPTIAFASSGGGYRSMLIGAGVLQAMDDRDSDEAVNGLYQAVTYHAGLSGGSWLLSSIVANGFETISSLSNGIWQGALEKNPLSPMNPENLGASSELNRVREDMLAKGKAGFSPVVTDAWGRFLESQTIAKSSEALGKSKGVIAHLFSDVARTRAFRRFETPFPIITALGVEDVQTICDAPDNATAYEFTPYEFGSWDKGVEAFTPTGSLGTTVVDGQPSGGQCKDRFDQLSYIMGTSSAKFNEQCGESLLSIIYSALEPLVKPAQRASSSARRNIFSPWPNPFKGSAGSPKVSSADELFLVDGGQANQNNPIWPLIQPARAVDVIIVNDNSADTDDNWPNATEIRHTFSLAQQNGLNRMPYVPWPSDFMARGLHKRASFFGCNEPAKATIVFLPNTNYSSFESNPPSSKFDFSRNETKEMILNGNMVATQGGDKEWPICLGCAISHKHAKSLPDSCIKCMAKYCVNPT